MSPQSRARHRDVRPAARDEEDRCDARRSRRAGRRLWRPLRLNQICWNLLANAVKFTPNGGHIALEVSRLNGNRRT